MAYRNVRERDLMYRLMISQLFYDGHQSVAVNLAKIIQPSPACPPSDRLYNVVSQGLKSEELETGEPVIPISTATPIHGIDLEYETDVETISPEAALYETCYVTAHKGQCRVAAYHPSGQLIATGSEDCSIKILDVDRMVAKSDMSAEAIALETSQQMSENHPVIRALYDHTMEVTSLDFHPVQQILASGGQDYSVRFFEFSKPSVKKAFKSIQEAYPVRCINFHPCGDYILVGTEHPTLRLYDVNTFECFVGSNPSDQHKAAITAVKYSPNHGMYVSSSIDGDIKIWDSVSNKCINTYKKAHDGAPVTSVTFSLNSKYVLSSGMDSQVKLWELCTHRCLIAYTGAGATGKQEYDTNAVFNHAEDYVFYPDEKSLSLCCWDSRNAERQKLLNLGHNNPVRYIAHSPTGPSFVTCSDDFRARFWVRKAAED